MDSLLLTMKVGQAANKFKVSVILMCLFKTLKETRKNFKTQGYSRLTPFFCVPVHSLISLFVYRHQRLQNAFVLKPNNMEDVKVRETHINVVRFLTVELFADTFMMFLYFFSLGIASGRRLSLMASFTNPDSKMKVSVCVKVLRRCCIVIFHRNLKKKPKKTPWLNSILEYS